MAAPVRPARVAGAVESLPLLHGDPAERRERCGLVQHPLGEVRVQPDPLPLAGGERRRLVPDGVGHPEPAEAADQRRLGAATCDLVGGQPERARRGRGEVGDGLRSGRACTAT